MTLYLLKKVKLFPYKLFAYRYGLTFYEESSLQKSIKAHVSGQAFNFTVGEYAKMADSCCIVRLGKTAVMATAVCGKETSIISSFVPLQVDYRQKYAAAGCIPSNYKRRELGQSEKEILTSRAIDRAIRPLFPKGFPYEIQISSYPIAIDHVNDPDILSINAASAALTVSSIPWNGPIGAVRIGIIDSKIVVNPSRKDISKSTLNLIVAATKQKEIVMMEGSASHITEDQFMEALDTGVNAAQLIIESINELHTQFGRPKTEYSEQLLPSTEIIESATLFCEARIMEILKNYSLDEINRMNAIDAVTQDVLTKLKENYVENDLVVLYGAINNTIRNCFRNQILDTNQRCDGRGITDIRDISCEVNKYEPLHGCSLFERGETQVLCTVAFGSIEAAVHNDPYSDIPNEEDKTFLLHYEFPPYATNEIGHIGKFGRREVGHGVLAEKSLNAVMPSKFPFTIRLTSEVLSSNGSSSMASVCGGSLALMDAGVPISTPVAGIAMGLISVSNPEEKLTVEKYKILTDIIGVEDNHGDMDFKIAGSKYGITAVQLDIKVPGLSLNIIEETLAQAKEAKLKILDIMNKTISIPREERKKNWPISENLEIPIHKLSQFIGRGGINLKNIHFKTGVQLIPIENGIFYIFAPNSEAWLEANNIIDELLQEKKKAPELIREKIYPATIVEIKDNGVMVTLYDGMEPALLRNPLLSSGEMKYPSAAQLKVGQKIDVQYFGKNPATGEIRLIRRNLLVSS